MREPMTLSDAIRLGAMLRPKAVNRFFGGGASCAGGAALEAVGCCYDATEDAQVFHAAIRSRWPWVITEVACPACGIRGRANQIIPHLNNTGVGKLGVAGHDWPREVIADWVQTIEPAAISAPADQETAVPTR